MIPQEQEARDEVLDLAAAAKLIDVSEVTLRRYCAQGRIPHARLPGGRKLRFIRRLIIRWIERGAPTPRGRSMGAAK